MKYAYKKINIKAPFPTTQLGHLCQTNVIDTYKDDLYARVFSFKDEKIWLFHVSLDLLCFDRTSRLFLQEKIRNHFNNKNIILITSATHTHYANNIRDDKYKDYLIDILFKEIISLEYQDKSNIKTSFVKSRNTIAGKSRISNYETNNEYTCLLNFYSEDKLFLSIVINNAHPTTLAANVPYFSSEYPGVLLNKLENKYRDVDFSFMQGASGDISSRFVREGQDYDGMLKIADKLFVLVDKLLNVECTSKPLVLNYEEKELPFDFDFSDIKIDEKELSELTDREKETINIGKQMRKDVASNKTLIFNKLDEVMNIGFLTLTSIKLIFIPNEIFSEYLNYLDLDKECLVSYSNGYGPYILPINFKYLTYEKFIDVSSDSLKKELIRLIKQ